MIKKTDIAIIGAGPGGLAAAQYSARANMNTIIFEGLANGGQGLLISELENYPGVKSISGFEFSQTLVNQAQDFGALIVSAQVQALYKDGKSFILETTDGIYQAKAVIAATGAKYKHVGVSGEQELIGRGVSYCATCDGPFFRDKPILVVGGGDAACDEAHYLSKLTHKITMIHRRDQFRAQKAVADRVLHNNSINIQWYTELKEIKGQKKVESVVLWNNQTQTYHEIDVDAVFIFIGSQPQNQLYSMAKKDENGYLVTDDHMQTNVPGLFAVGDLRHALFHQVVTACSDGAIAAHAASHYIEDLKSIDFYEI
jgi:thioredoxin reductase (NADPH)